jgi:hypothetical protein
MLMALTAWSYWQSTGVRDVPALIEQLHDLDPSTMTTVSIWIQVTILFHPDAQGAIAYLFLPVVLLVLLPVGYAGGGSSVPC